MNIAILKGNLTRDPEVKFLPSGMQVTSFGIAVNEVWYNSDKVKQERTHFFDCESFGGTAKTIGDFFKKGRPILIEGKLSYEQWEKDGQKRSAIRIKVDRFHFCGDNPGGERRKEQAHPGPEIKPDTDLDSAEDDIPF